MSKIPSDNQIRNPLDGVNPQVLSKIYRYIFVELERSKILEGYSSFARQLLVAIDGTQYFSSNAIHCEECSHRTLNNRKVNYFHSALTLVIVQAGNENVIALEPEFIVPQDGHEKQDCELQAAKRWLEQYGDLYAQFGVTVLGDDLFSHEPFCCLLISRRLHLILVCKPDWHEFLYQTLEFLEKNGGVKSKVVRHWNGRYAEVYTYRYANQLQLNANAHALRVNWCEVSVTREDNSERLYKNAFITDFEVTETTVEALVRDGQERWKVENEHYNVLKIKGYHVEHNFGHGKQYLASLLLSFNLLAFLFHTVSSLVDEQYQAIRRALGTRRKFFQDIEALLRYFEFESWEAVFRFMFKGLELYTG